MGLGATAHLHRRRTVARACYGAVAGHSNTDVMTPVTWSSLWRVARVCAGHNCRSTRVRCLPCLQIQLCAPAFCRSKCIICLPLSLHICHLSAILLYPSSVFRHCYSKCIIYLPLLLKMCHLSAILLDPSSVFRHCHSKCVICLPLSLQMRHLSAIVPDPSSVFQ